MQPIVVDGHSHVFNAEDIPINGFLNRRLRTPALLTGVFSVPLDLVAAGRATGGVEAVRLLALIAARLDGTPADGGLEAVGAGEPEAALSGAELDAGSCCTSRWSAQSLPTAGPMTAAWSPSAIPRPLSPTSSPTPHPSSSPSSTSGSVCGTSRTARKDSSTTSAPRRGLCAWWPSGSATPCG